MESDVKFQFLDYSYSTNQGDVTAIYKRPARSHA